MDCKICKKKFKGQKTLDAHILKYHYEYQIIKINNIPKDVLCYILTFLSPSNLLKCYNAGINLFFSEYNHIWEKYIKQIKSNRKLNYVSYGLSYLKYENNLCFDCLEKATILIFYGIPICKQCQKNNYPLITKTNAIKEYKISKDQLEKTQHINVKNPHYKNSYDMCLYLKSDIIKLSLNNTPKKQIDPIKKEENFAKKCEKIKKFIEKENMQEYTYYINNKMSYNRIKEICERHKNLATKLYDTYCLKIRHDSKLCEEYITKNSEYDIDEIIEIVAETHWLHNYTNYNELIKKEIQEYKKYRIRYDYYDIEHSVREKLRKKAPLIYPWLTNLADV